MASDLVLTLDNFSLSPEELAKHDVLFVDFWAPWCNPCRMIAPIIDQLAEEFNGQAAIGKLNIDDHEEAAASFGVASIPTMIIFKNGQEAERIVGARPRAQLSEAIRKHL